LRGESGTVQPKYTYKTGTQTPQTSRLCEAKTLPDLRDTSDFELLPQVYTSFVAEANSLLNGSLLRVYLAVYLPGMFFYHPHKDGTSGEFADHLRIDGTPVEAEISGEVRDFYR
jgi:hypothetical protein